MLNKGQRLKKEKFKEKLETVKFILAIMGFFAMIGGIIYMTITGNKQTNTIEAEYVNCLYTNKDLSLDDISKIKNDNNLSLNLQEYLKGKITAVNKTGNQEMSIEVQNQFGKTQTLNIYDYEIRLVDVLTKSYAKISLSDDGQMVIGKNNIDLSYLKENNIIAFQSNASKGRGSYTVFILLESNKSDSIIVK